MTETMNITRVIEFDAGHRLVGHESKCAHLHGHRYRAEISVSARWLDSIGRVIDFSKIKEVVGGWIDQYWDHNMILNSDDPLLNGPEMYLTRESIFGNKLPYVMLTNPTVENMVDILARQSQILLRPFDISVSRVRLYETPNCWADFSF